MKKYGITKTVVFKWIKLYVISIVVAVPLSLILAFIIGRGDPDSSLFVPFIFGFLLSILTFVFYTAAATQWVKLKSKKSGRMLPYILHVTTIGINVSLGIIMSFEELREIIFHSDYAVGAIAIFVSSSFASYAVWFMRHRISMRNNGRIDIRGKL